MSEYLYILFDEPNKNLIIGTTSNLLMHMHEIKNKTNDIYKNEYETNKLAYYEKFDELSQVIIRENELKNLSKENIITLIKEDNPQWNDLHDTILKIWNTSAKLHDKKQITQKGDNIWKPLH